MAQPPKAGSITGAVPVTVPYTPPTISSNSKHLRCDNTFQNFLFRTSVELLGCGVTVFAVRSLVTPHSLHCFLLSSRPFTGTCRIVHSQQRVSCLVHRACSCPFNPTSALPTPPNTPLLLCVSRPFVSFNPIPRVEVCQNICIMSSEAADAPVAGGSLADRVSKPDDASQSTGTESRPAAADSRCGRSDTPAALAIWSLFISSANQECSSGP